MENSAYRFSGYNLPMIQLDETGPSYVVVGVHPYYINQPTEWQKPYYQTSPITTGLVDQNGNSDTQSSSSSNLNGMLPL